MSHLRRSVIAMDKRCECGEILEPISGDEMGSAPRRFLCPVCEAVYEMDTSGLLVEVDDRRALS